MVSRPRVAWIADTDAPVLASPLVVGDVLYAVDAKGFVYAFDAGDGSTRWRGGGVDARFGATWAPGSFRDPVLCHAPAVGGDLLFIGDTEYEGCVFVYDRHTGELLRELPDGWPTVVGDVLLIAHLNDGVRALSLPDLSAIWHSGSRTGLLAAPPAVEQGIAYAALGFEGNHTHSGLCAFDVASGRELYQLGDDHEVCPLPPAADDEAEEELPEDWLLLDPVHAVVANGLVWMPMRREHEDDGLHEWGSWVNGEITGLDLRTGEQRWHCALEVREQSIITAAVAVVDGMVCFTAAHFGVPDEERVPVRHVLHAVDVATRSPLWTAPLSGAAVGAPVFAGGVLLVATRSGSVHAFEPTTGRPAWAVETGREIINKYDLVEDTGACYEEDGRAVLPGEGRIYLRTGSGVVALAV